MALAGGGVDNGVAEFAVEVFPAMGEAVSDLGLVGGTGMFLFTGIGGAVLVMSLQRSLIAQCVTLRQLQLKSDTRIALGHSVGQGGRRFSARNFNTSCGACMQLLPPECPRIEASRQ